MTSAVTRNNVGSVCCFQSTFANAIIHLHYIGLVRTAAADNPYIEKLQPKSDVT